MTKAMHADVDALIEQGCAELKLLMPAGAEARLARYLELMEKWNRGQNLTAVSGVEAMATRHLLDSLAGVPWLSGESVLDVGSGAGLPGIPLAIAQPSRRFVLLDSRRKRVQFLLYTKQALSLHNVEVVEARVEKYRPGEKFGTLTARAFAAFPELATRTMPFVTAGARLVVWQRNDPTQALGEAFAGHPVRYVVHPVRVPGIEAPRHIVVVDRAGG